MGKVKVLKFFLVVVAVAVFISGSMVSVEAGTPLGVFCWSLADATGLVSEMELAINDDAPPTLTHLSAVGVWTRYQGEACVPVHGTVQRDRRIAENYELALSYEDIVDFPSIQGHFHAKFDLLTLAGPFSYEDEESGFVMVGGMAPIPCPIICP